MNWLREVVSFCHITKFKSLSGKSYSAPLRLRVAKSCSISLTFVLALTTMPVSIVSAASAEWQIAGGTSAVEGACSTYTVSTTGSFDSVATVDLSTIDLTASATDYDSLNTAVTTAVAAYTGPGTLTWDGTALTFDGGGTSQMAALSFDLCATTDTLSEGTESYDVALSNPTELSCVMPEMLARARINGGNSATSMNHIDNVVTSFGTNGTTTTWTDQGAGVYSFSAGTLTNTTGQNSTYTYSDNTLPADEDGYIEFSLSNPLASPMQLDVGFGNLTYPVSDYFIVDLNTVSSGGWRTNGLMAGFVGVSDGNDPIGSTPWQPGTAAGDMYKIAREGCDMKWYRNGTVIRNLTRKSTSVAGAITAGADTVTTEINDPIDTDADGVADDLDLDDDNDGILDAVERGSGSPPPVLGVQDTSVNWIDFKFSTLIGSTWDAGNGDPWGVIGTYDLGALSPSLAGIMVTISTASNDPTNASIFLGASSGTFRSGFSSFTLQFSQPVDIRREAINGVAFGPGEGETHTSDSGMHFTSGSSATVNLVTDTGSGTSSIDAFGLTDIQAPKLTQALRMEIGEDPRIISLGADSDADGVLNHLDLDSDNDGISDLYESGDTAGVTADANADGTVAVAEDVDTDSDGLMDVFEDGNLAADAGTTPQDSDADGMDNSIDLDSDADGIPDTVEARPTSGYVGNDGNVSDEDADGDGIVALFDTNDASTADFGGDHANLNAPVDTDSDSVADFLDLNSDGDGHNDLVESSLSGMMTSLDVNTDGLDDGINPVGFEDPDGLVNAPITDLQNTDTDVSDADYRSLQDTDADGVADYFDLDDDNDGLLDTDEMSPAVPGAIQQISNWVLTSGSSSGDGIGTPATYTGTVTLADGTIVTATLSGTHSVTNATASTTLGAGESPALSTWVLTLDTPVEYRVSTVALGNPNVPTGWSVIPIEVIFDRPWDSITDTGVVITGSNSYEGMANTSAFPIFTGQGVTWTMQQLGTETTLGNINLRVHIYGKAISPVDTDADGVFDQLDLDSDNDGISDHYESGADAATLDPDGNGVIDATQWVDADTDGLSDDIETTNGPDSGTMPVDTDADGRNDQLDLDTDGDGIPDTIEARPTAGYVSNDGNVSDEDADGDGIIALFDSNDGTTADFGGDHANFNAPVDTDSDSTPDWLDADSDDDGQPDSIETTAPAFSTFADPDGVVSTTSPDLSNETGDLSEIGFREISDSDGDGVSNAIDLDDDNDGIPDQTEQTCSVTATAVWDTATVAGDLSSTLTLESGVTAAVAITTGHSRAGFPSFTSSATTLTVANDGEYNPLSDGTETVYTFSSPIINHTFYLDGVGTNDTWFDESQVVSFFNGGVPVAIAPTVITTGGSFAAGLATGTNTTPHAKYEFLLTQAVDEIRIKHVGSGSNGSAGWVGSSISSAGCPVADFDADGQADYLDLDSDNDGITDTVEAGGTDADGDGIVDGFTDSDNDGLDDATGAAPMPVNDFDNDGQADYLDLDSDNDGLTDASEAGGSDADGNGVIDGFSDANDDGLDDSTAATPLPVTDTDGDLSPDYLDLDSDADGINDIIEGGGTDTNADGVVDSFTDADNNGLDDATEATPLPDDDFDGDGIADHQDVDSDNDGIPDAVEAANGAVDSDGDGEYDHLDLDADNDGLPDATEGPGDNADADGDGIDDYYDVNVSGGTDANNDGIDDAIVAEDFDGDGVADYLDLDSDNDGITDANEADGLGGPADADGDGVIDGFTDADGDGLDDTTAATPLPITDTDGDNQPDHLDLDSDNDGLTDVIESGGGDTDGDGMVDGFTDADNNGFHDGSAGTEGTDFDGDGIPNEQDVDSDGDGIW